MDSFPHLMLDPNMALLALILGLCGIVFEFHAPGGILPGVVGTALVLLAAARLSQFPLQPSGVALTAVATLLFLLEFKTGSYGVLAVAGAVLLACGMYLLVDTGDPEQHIRPAVAAGAVLPFGLATAFLITIAARARTNKVSTGSGLLVGRTATVVEGSADMHVHARVKVAGEYWSAVSQHALTPGDTVRIVAVDGLLLSVSPLHDTMNTL